MAFYPNFNNYNNFNPYQQQMPQIPQAGTYQSMAQPLQTQTVIRVPSYESVKGFYVEAGKPVTFFDDNIPFCYVKTAGASPVDPPKTRIFELVERTEEDLMRGAKNDLTAAPVENSIDLSPYAKTTDLDAVSAKIDGILRDMDKMRLDIDAVQDKSTKKMVQKARKDADEE